MFSHPSFLTKEDVDTVTVPIHVNEAETDSIYTPEIRDYWNSVLEKKGLLSHHFYPGTQHGFSVRPSDEKSTEQAKLATQNTIAFFKKQQ